VLSETLKLRELAAKGLSTAVAPAHSRGLALRTGEGSSINLRWTKRC
jgi:hypothetical protein